MLEAAEELGYKSNYYAQTLATKKSKVIGISFNMENNEYSVFHQNIINGILSVCGEKKYHLLIEPTIQETHTFFPIDGKIILNPDEYDISINHPNHVWVGTPPISERGKIAYTDNDNQKIGEQVVHYMLENNIQNIGFLNGLETKTVSQDRKTGYERALKDKGNFKKERHFFLKKREAPNLFAYQATKYLLENDKIEGLIVDSDFMAQGVYQACHDLGKNIPEDLSVIGICSGFLSEGLQPSLTTVELNEFELGREAASLLIECLEKGEDTFNHKILIPAEIHPKDSVRLLKN